MCPHCRAFITNKDRICPYCNEPVGPRAIDVRSPGDVLGIPHGRFTTALLLLINAGIYLATVVYSMGAGNGNALFSLDMMTLARFGAKIPEFIFEGQWWRLVTA